MERSKNRTVFHIMSIQYNIVIRFKNIIAGIGKNCSRLVILTVKIMVKIKLLIYGTLNHRIIYLCAIHHKPSDKV